MVAARKAGLERADDGREPTLYEIPFDSERKAMSVLVGERDGKAILYTKGAPEVILARCTAIRSAGTVEPLTERHREAVTRANTDMASQALRVLALAYREGVDPGTGPEVETDLVFAGLVGMIDPPREEVKEAVRISREAGMRPVMVTGDHPAMGIVAKNRSSASRPPAEAPTPTMCDGGSSFSSLG